MSHFFFHQAWVTTISRDHGKGLDMSKMSNLLTRYVLICTTILHMETREHGSRNLSLSWMKNFWDLNAAGKIYCLPGGGFACMKGVKGGRAGALKPQQTTCSFITIHTLCSTSHTAILFCSQGNYLKCLSNAIVQKYTRVLFTIRSHFAACKPACFSGCCYPQASAQRKLHHINTVMERVQTDNSWTTELKKNPLICVCKVSDNVYTI